MNYFMLLGYIATVLSFIGIVLNAKKKISCWIVWCIANLFWITYSLIEKDYPSVILWTVYTFANIYALNEWKKDKK